MCTFTASSDSSTTLTLLPIVTHVPHHSTKKTKSPVAPMLLIQGSCLSLCLSFKYSATRDSRRTLLPGSQAFPLDLLLSPLQADLPPSSSLWNSRCPQGPTLSPPLSSFYTLSRRLHFSISCFVVIFKAYPSFLLKLFVKHPHRKSD